MARFFLAVTLALAVSACGSSASNGTKTVEALARGCANPPVERFIPHQGGVPNSWFVVLVNGTPIYTTADALTDKYGGRIENVFESLGMLVVQDIDATAAEKISSEPSVCFVEQDDYTRGAGAPAPSP